MIGLLPALLVAACATTNSEKTGSSHAALSNAIRVYAGDSDYTDATGHVWAADSSYASGGNVTLIRNPISATSDATIYQAERFGTFGYSLPLPDGCYDVTLRFAEIWFTSAGDRVFDVSIEGQQVLHDFDILAETQPNTALDKHFDVAVTGGTLNLDFSATVDNAKISGVEVLPRECGQAPSPAPSPAPAPSPQPSPGGGVSGESAPTGDLPGWKLQYVDDFNRSTLGGDWGPYSGQPGGDSLAVWDPSHVDVSAGMLHLITYEDGAHPGLWTSGGAWLSPAAQMYGKYLVRLRSDKAPGNNVSSIALLWPSDNSWPPEIDFYEDSGDNRLGTTATVHYGSNDSMIHSSLDDIDFSQWHTVGVEWTAGTVKYTIDDRVWATVGDNNVSSMKMNLVLQAQTWTAMQAGERVEMQVDWVAIYSPQ